MFGTLPELLWVSLHIPGLSLPDPGGGLRYRAIQNHILPVLADTILHMLTRKVHNPTPLRSQFSDPAARLSAEDSLHEVVERGLPMGRGMAMAINMPEVRNGVFFQEAVCPLTDVKQVVLIAT
jgi:hypothetical protein